VPGLSARVSRALVLAWVLWDVAHQLLRGRQAWLLQQQGVLARWPWAVAWGWVLGVSLFWALVGALWWVGMARNQRWAWRWAWGLGVAYTLARAAEAALWADPVLVRPRLAFWLGYVALGLAAWRVWVRAAQPPDAFEARPAPPEPSHSKEAT